jgi:hypothetical protein
MLRNNRTVSFLRKSESNSFERYPHAVCQVKTSGSGGASDRLYLLTCCILNFDIFV